MSASRISLFEVAEEESEEVLVSLLDSGQEVDLGATGSSMRPALLPGDRAVVVPFLGPPRPGQIVMARGAKGPVARRLVAVDLVSGRRVYRLRADAIPSLRESVTREDLLGRVIGVVRGGRRLEMDEAPGIGARGPR